MSLVHGMARKPFPRNTSYCNTSFTKIPIVYSNSFALEMWQYPKSLLSWHQHLKTSYPQTSWLSVVNQMNAMNKSYLQPPQDRICSSAQVLQNKSANNKDVTCKRHKNSDVTIKSTTPPGLRPSSCKFHPKLFVFLERFSPVCLSRSMISSPCLSTLHCCSLPLSPPASAGARQRLLIFGRSQWLHENTDQTCQTK